MEAEGGGGRGRRGQLPYFSLGRPLVEFMKQEVSTVFIRQIVLGMKLTSLLLVSGYFFLFLFKQLISDYVF